MNRRHHGTRLVLVGAVFASLRVLGQTPEEDATRRKLLDTAKKAHLAGNHAQALSLAARAAEIRSTPSVRQFIAEEQYEVGQLENSTNNAELCVIEATEDKALRHREEILADCQELIVQLKKSVARIVVSLP